MRWELQLPAERGGCQRAERGQKVGWGRSCRGKTSLWELCSLLIKIYISLYCILGCRGISRSIFRDQIFVGWDVWSVLTCALFFLLQHWSYQVREAAGSLRVQSSSQICSRVLSFYSAGTDLFHACKRTGFCLMAVCVWQVSRIILVTFRPAPS